MIVSYVIYVYIISTVRVRILFPCCSLFLHHPRILLVVQYWYGITTTTHQDVLLLTMQVGWCVVTRLALSFLIKMSTMIGTTITISTIVVVVVVVVVVIVLIGRRTTTTLTVVVITTPTTRLIITSVIT